MAKKSPMREFVKSVAGRLLKMLDKKAEIKPVPKMLEIWL